MKTITKTLFAALLAASMIGCGKTTVTEEPAATEAPAEATAEATAEAVESPDASAVGKWHLVKVSGEKADGDVLELDPETHQSFYAAADGYMELREDGTGVHVMNDGPDTAETELTWTAKDNVYTVTEGTIVTEFTYDADTKTMVYRVDDPEGEFVDYVFVYIPVTE